MALPQQMHKGQFCVCRHNADALLLVVTNHSLCPALPFDSQTFSHKDVRSTLSFLIMKHFRRWIASRYSDWPYKLSDDSAIYRLSYSNQIAQQYTDWATAYQKAHQYTDWVTTCQIIQQYTDWATSCDRSTELQSVVEADALFPLTSVLPSGFRVLLARGTKTRAWGWIFILIECWGEGSARRLHDVVLQRGGGQSDVTVSTVAATSGKELQSDVTISNIAATCSTVTEPRQCHYSHWPFCSGFPTVTYKSNDPVTYNTKTKFL